MQSCCLEPLCRPDLDRLALHQHRDVAITYESITCRGAEEEGFDSPPGLSISEEDSEMRKVVRHHRIFWVGLLKRHNSEERGFVIYDPKVQHRTVHDVYVTLFETAEMRSGEFRKEVVRDLIGNPIPQSDSAINAALDRYLEAAGIDVESEYREIEKQQPRVSRHRYENQCWKCQRGVNDETLDRCADGCGWVKCSCGSWLCDMPLLKRLQRPHKVKIKYITRAARNCPRCDGVGFVWSEEESNRRDMEEHYTPDLTQYSRCVECGGKGYKS